MCCLGLLERRDDRVLGIERCEEEEQSLLGFCGRCEEDGWRAVEDCATLLLERLSCCGEQKLPGLTEEGEM
jgi:hypothetical protein